MACELRNTLDRIELWIRTEDLFNKFLLTSFVTNVLPHNVTNGAQLKNPKNMFALLAALFYIVSHSQN